ncbi:hypothetical protein NE237_007730 [Protea cynaroides]|uniref:Uncharacterized protein n=1 Tax=Protea cynaroides TaxID=273540 RepID=A0A9Q0KQS6_9MAGN|nr:hypothetical protein NE237_007730 [Protea cynaroides]
MLVILHGETGKEIGTNSFSELHESINNGYQGSQTTSLKLLIDEEHNKVVIAELTVIFLYEGVEKLEQQFLQICKSMLLHPKNPSEKEYRKLKLNIDDTEPPSTIFLGGWCGWYSSFKNARCSTCGETMDKDTSMEEDVVATSEGDGGVHVHGIAHVSNCYHDMLPKLGFKDMSSLQEITLSIGSEEVWISPCNDEFLPFNWL